MKMPGRVGAMHNHEPSGYDCPFCRLVAGAETERNRGADVVIRERGTTAIVAPKWWPGNAGHVLVVPDRHVENLYDADDELLAAVYATVRRGAVAIRGPYARRLRTYFTA